VKYMIEQGGTHLDADDIAALTKFKQKRAEGLAQQAEKTQEEAKFEAKISFLKWSNEKDVFDRSADPDVVTPASLISEHGVTTEAEIKAADEARKKAALSSQKGFSAIGRYDGALEMFVEAPHDPDMNNLRLLRWLAENGRLEHPIVGPASGELASTPGVQTLTQVTEQVIYRSPSDVIRVNKPEQA
jgi:hypothetical protein